MELYASKLYCVLCIITLPHDYSFVSFVTDITKYCVWEKLTNLCCFSRTKITSLWSCIGKVKPTSLGISYATPSAEYITETEYHLILQGFCQKIIQLFVRWLVPDVHSCIFTCDLKWWYFNAIILVLGEKFVPIVILIHDVGSIQAMLIQFDQPARRHKVLFVPVFL